ncbi:MAG: response regulator [Gammaproteobacteria bacterium]|nr:response regulator [Gammaproteobacteria bacterium]MBU1646261.1 response regulator [Gammaproteobacteria bacterium]MBU1971187.1 response regulator [Gammaproteobacteria bacterium]
MSDGTKILVVDDDAFTRELFDAALGGNYQLQLVENGRDALMIADAERPDLILLDVELPDIDGYEVCRKLRQAEGGADVPVIFVSGHDGIEDRIKGYESGGDDYVVKPFEQKELLAKIVRLLRITDERRSLGDRASSASQTAMTAMTSMSEMGALLQSLQSFNGCGDQTALADAALAGLGYYGLQGIVQIRATAGTLTRTAQGTASPLETSVIGHMAGMERIVQFQSRLAVNYPRVTLMVKDMPLADPDRCGRLRDHLAVLAESAEVRAAAIDATISAQKRSTAIGRVIDSIIATLGEIDTGQRQSRIATQLAVDAFTGQMEQAYVSVALSEAQEDLMAEIVRAGLNRILDAQSAELDLQDRLSSIIAELKDIAAVDGAKP